VEPPLDAVDEAVRRAAGVLAVAGISEAEADAKLLLTAALRGIDGVPDEAGKLTARTLGTYESYVRRRAAREPLEYIVGSCTFRGLELEVWRGVHIPFAPWTSVLVDVALAEGGLTAGARVHDVGTGNGAIALALKHERVDLRVSGSDVSQTAIDLARRNATRLRLDVAFAVARGLPEGNYDSVVANLPWGCDGDVAGLEPELRAQPRVAITSGADGLDAIRGLIAGVPSGTYLVLEHSPRQLDGIRSWSRWRGAMASMTLATW